MFWNIVIKLSVLQHLLKHLLLTLTSSNRKYHKWIICSHKVDSRIIWKEEENQKKVKFLRISLFLEGMILHLMFQIEPNKVLYFCRIFGRDEDGLVEMKQSKIRIQIQRWHIFNSFTKIHESLYDFMLLQQNNRKKPIEVQ